VIRLLNPLAWFTPEPEPSAQCASQSAQCAVSDSQCALTPEQRAETAIKQLESDWTAAIVAAQCAVNHGSRSLALAFRHTLQSRPELLNWGVVSQWVRSNYQPFCQAANVVAPPPYKDFAKELALATPRSRKWHWHEGRRTRVRTYYWVRDPATTVVELAAIKAKRA
jgi:hypothetical protein